MYLCDGGPETVLQTHVAAITPSSVISPNATSFAPSLKAQNGEQKNHGLYL